MRGAKLGLKWSWECHGVGVDIFFLVGTLLATVYLGWHFAVDDLAGLVIAVVSVALGRRMIYPRRQAAVTPDEAVTMPGVFEEVPS